MSRRNAALLLAGAVAVAFGFRLHSLGFYNDDYSWLEILHRASGGILDRAAWFLRRNGGLWERPLAPLFYSALYSPFGLAPLPYHLVYLALDAAIAWNLFRLLEDEGVPPPQAFAAALLAALYPNHDAAHHWLAAAGAPFGLALTLAGLRAFRAWGRERRPAALAAALAAIAVAGLTYEASLLLPLAAPLIESGMDRRKLGAALRSSAPLVLAIAAVVLFQRVWIPATRHTDRHFMSLSVAHGLRVLASGIECTFANRLAHLIGRGAVFAARDFGALEWLGFAAFAAALASGAAALAPRLGAPHPRLPALGAAFFLLGYAPYALDANYSPAVFSEVNRINLAPSTGGAMILAWLVARVAARRARAAAAALAALLAAFALSDWASNAQWARAHELQVRILDAIGRRVAPAGRPRLVLLFGAPTTIGSATVFQSTYDLDSALRLRFDDPALRGLVGTDRISFEPGRAVLHWFGETPIPYRDLYAYDYASDRFQAIPDRDAGERWLASLSR